MIRKLLLTLLLACLIFPASAAAEEGSASPAVSVPLLDEARRLAGEGSLLPAREKYKEALTLSAEISSALRASIRSELEDLNMKILFSKTVTPDSVLYVVEPGDSLYKLAKRYNTTIALIRRSNAIEGDKILPGQKLKIVTKKFSVAVDVSRNELYLKQGGETVKTYRVATGEKKSKTPLGTFTVVNKLENPTWYHAGAVVPPDSPENILGTRWLGFSKAGYGIHGTTLPNTIGTASSAGCVRMLNEEVEELYDIIPEKTEVTIAE